MDPLSWRPPFGSALVRGVQRLAAATFCQANDAARRDRLAEVVLDSNASGANRDLMLRALRAILAERISASTPGSGATPSSS
jgi:hypothetical protein